MATGSPASTFALARTALTQAGALARSWITWFQGLATTMFSVDAKGSVQRSIYDKISETLTPLDFGAFGDLKTDDAAAVQSLFNAAATGAHIHFPATAAGGYLISRGIQLTSLRNVTITADQGVELRFADGAADNPYTSWPSFGQDSLIRLVGCSGVTIEGLFVSGNIANRTAHVGSESENSCILIAGCEGVTIRNCVIEQGMTDGIFVGPDSAGNCSTNIRIADNQIDACRRNNISLVGHDGVWIVRSRLTNAGTIQGIAPQSAIDVELDNSANVSRNVFIIDNEISGSAGTYAVSCGGLGTAGLIVADNHIHDNANWGINFESTAALTPYATGTIGATNGQTTIVGTGTTWTSAMAANGYITINGYLYEIAQGGFIDATHLTLATPFLQATASGLAYSLSYGQNRDAVLSGGLIENNASAGVRIVGRNLDDVQQVKIRNNSGAIYLYAPDGILISNCLIEGNLNQAIANDPTGPFINVHIRGCLFRDNFSETGFLNGAFGVAFSGNPASASACLTFDGNVILGTVTPGVLSPSGLLIGGTYANSYRGRANGNTAIGLDPLTTLAWLNTTLGAGNHNYDLDGTANQAYADSMSAGANFSPNNGGGVFRLYERRLVYGTAAPTTGAWVSGEVCLNETPTNGGPAGWICITAGTPGTWIALYADDGTVANTLTLASLHTISITAGGRLISWT